jgi:hypothetical protein
MALPLSFEKTKTWPFLAVILGEKPKPGRSLPLSSEKNKNLAVPCLYPRRK